MQFSAARVQAPAPTCLIVEDSQFDHVMMTRVLDRAQTGMQVKVATTLDAARMAIATGQVSLILLDNDLPDGHGVNFALELAEDPRATDIPVIMVSDWPTPFMGAKAAKAGVLHIVNKSDFNVPFLKGALRDGLMKKRRLH